MGKSKNVFNREKVEVASKSKKIMENHLRWFGHERRGPTQKI